MNPQVGTLSGTVPGTSRNTDMEKHDPNGDRFHNDPRLEVGSSVYRSRHSVDSDPDEVPPSRFWRVNIETQVSADIQFIKGKNQRESKNKCVSLNQNTGSIYSGRKWEVSRILRGHNVVSDHIALTFRLSTGQMPIFWIKRDLFCSFCKLFLWKGMFLNSALSIALLIWNENHWGRFFFWRSLWNSKSIPQKDHFKTNSVFKVQDVAKRSQSENTIVKIAYRHVAYSTKSCVES